MPVSISLSLLSRCSTTRGHETKISWVLWDEGGWAHSSSRISHIRPKDHDNRELSVVLLNNLGALMCIWT